MVGAATDASTSRTSVASKATLKAAAAVGVAENRMSFASQVRNDGSSRSDSAPQSTQKREAHASVPHASVVM